MMRAFTFILTLIFSSALYAQCQNEPISATYQIERQSTANDKTEIRHLVLSRLNGQVALQNPEAEITELWNKTGNGKLHLIRYFDRYQRGIEYQPGEIRSRHSGADWSSKYQLLSDDFIQTLTLTESQESQNEGCQRTETYHATVAATSSQLTWLPEYSLPKLYVEKTPATTIRWTLTEIETNPAEIRPKFDVLASFQTTDYADIGDNESDPFLLKMINLGFVEHGSNGFYDADGNTLDGDHHH